MIIKTADEVTAQPVEAEGARDVQIRWLLHEPDAAPNFYMRQFNVAPGGSTPRHQHAWEHEIYVLAGRGAAVTRDGERPVQAGQCIYVAPEEDHQFRNTGDEEMIFLCLVPRT
jgi:quercetin dioxygenase-like cupin family protein